MEGIRSALEGSRVVMSPREIVEVLGCSDETVYRAIRSGTLPASSLGQTKGYRVLREDVVRWWDSTSVIKQHEVRIDLMKPVRRFGGNR